MKFRAIARAAATGALLAMLAGGSHAASVAFSGMLGDKALLVIDGQPRSVAVGTTVAAVRLVRLEGNVATVDVGGKALSLRMGGGAKVAGADGSGTGTRIVLPIGPGGHYGGQATINGRSVDFIVDTGATSLAMSADMANRLGLDFSTSQAAAAMTANGAVPARRLSLGSVRIGDVTVTNVECLVVPQTMPVLLLGNSFLSHFQMHSDSESLVLDKRL